MELETLREALQDAVAQVLEEAAFAFVQPAPDPGAAPSWPGELIRARLSFRGPMNGTFSLAAQPGLCATLAADMIVEADDEGSGEVLGEILNMVAGLVLERALAGQGLWELGVPDVEHIPADGRAGAPPPDIGTLLLTEDGEPIEATVTVAREGR